MERPVDRLELMAAEFRLGTVSPEGAVERAGQMLVDLPGNEALVEMAGARPTRHTVQDLIEAALGEEESTVPTALEAGRLVAGEVGRAIVRGDVTPIGGARVIWCDVVRQVPELAGELGHFIGLASEWEDDTTHRDQYEEDIRRAARELTGS